MKRFKRFDFVTIPAKYENGVELDNPHEGKVFVITEKTDKDNSVFSIRDIDSSEVLSVQEFDMLPYEGNIHYKIDLKGEFPVISKDLMTNKKYSTLKIGYSSLEFVGTKQEFTEFFDKELKNETLCKVIGIDYKTLK